ncbi:hypothetical protein ES703_58917 [subsurface metagenome]
MDKRKDYTFGIQDGVLSEFYQLNPEELGNLYCYKLKLIGGNLNKVGGKLGYQLPNKFSGFWNFSDYILLSNSFIEEKQLNKFVEELWAKETETYKNLTEITFLKDKTPSTKAIADFIANFLKFRYKNEIVRILDKYKEEEAKIKIKKECIIRGWSINNLPAISVSIKSNIYYDDTFEKFLKTLENEEKIINFPVIDIELEHTGKISGIAGILKEHRKRLLSYTKREKIKQKLHEAPDNEEVLIIDGFYHYTASTLHPLVITKNAHLFEANASKLMSHLTISPEIRNSIENEIVSLFKNYIISNFNSVNTPELFKKGEGIGFKNQLKFKDGSIHSEEEYVLNTLKKHGIYKLSPKFEDDPSLEVMLLLSSTFNRYQDFWEKLKTELIELGFAPKLKNTIKFDKISPIEIEKKIEIISSENCDIIIAILPEKPNQDRIYELVKSTLFNFNLVKSQFIFEKTIHEKLQWALANVILGILAKTENIPYILANPLDFADFFVGIDISREKKKSLTGSQNYAATARFYGKDGTFKHYEIQEDKIEGETLPKIILERMFAKTKFQDKTIMIHRDGYFRGEEISYLKELGANYNIKFQFVEVIKRNVPRLFKIANSTPLNPDKNQIFYISQKEAIIVNNKVQGAKTANPLRIRVCDSETKLDDAIISVMAFRMMHFGTTKTPKLPVTISFSDRISGFVRRGIKPQNKSGKIPWWYYLILLDDNILLDIGYIYIEIGRSS